MTAITAIISHVLKSRSIDCLATLVSSSTLIATINAVFLKTEMYVLIDDGSAIRPPIGSETLRKVLNGPKPSA